MCTYTKWIKSIQIESHLLPHFSKFIFTHLEFILTPKILCKKAQLTREMRRCNCGQRLLLKSRMYHSFTSTEKQIQDSLPTYLHVSDPADKKIELTRDTDKFCATLVANTWVFFFYPRFDNPPKNFPRSELLPYTDERGLTWTKKRIHLRQCS